ncbi:MAG: DsbA family oxidoreductase [Kurthia sp.]|nr:DsbA family oxidoreductase [Candidatus Kurthia equi]
MLIEIFTDYTCPFCYIAKQRLKLALAKVELKQKVEIVYVSYEINPTIDKENKKKYIEFLEETMSQVKATSFMEELTEHAKEVGLTYNFDRMIVANTSDAHRLAKWVNEQGKEEQYTEILMHGYFVEGRNLSDHIYLLEVIDSLELSKTKAKEVLESNTYQQQIDLDKYAAQQIGVTSAPFFVFNNRLGIRGAEPEEVFIRTIKQASGEYSQ